MKNALLIVCVAGMGLISCKKDKFTSTPQIEFVDISPNVVTRNLLSTEKYLAPVLTLKITDSEGDFGSPSPTDSSCIIIKHLLSNNIDSLKFPDLSRAPKNNFEAEIEINLFDALDCYAPGPARPRVDTIFYEVYVRDAKNKKSNVITTTKPVLKTCE